MTPSVAFAKWQALDSELYIHSRLICTRILRTCFFCPVFAGVEPEVDSDSSSSYRSSSKYSEATVTSSLPHHTAHDKGGRAYAGDTPNEGSFSWLPHSQSQVIFATVPPQRVPVHTTWHKNLVGSGSSWGSAMDLMNWGPCVINDLPPPTSICLVLYSSWAHLLQESPLLLIKSFLENSTLSHTAAPTSQVLKNYLLSWKGSSVSKMTAIQVLRLKTHVKKLIAWPGRDVVPEAYWPVSIA